VVGALDQRDDLDRGEAGLPAPLVVERADPDQPVGARLDVEVPERIRRLDLEGGRLEPGLLRVARVEDGRRVAVPLRPAQVHPHEHLGEVGRVDASGAGADGDDGLALVVLAREEGAHLELADVPLEGGQLTLGLRHGLRVATVLGAHLDERLEVLDALVHPDDPLELGVGPRQLGRDPLGPLLVVPEVRDGGLLLQVGDLAAQPVEVGHLAHRVHRRAQGPDLLGIVDSHKDPA
jgi:hypothetical protein